MNSGIGNTEITQFLLLLRVEKKNVMISEQEAFIVASTLLTAKEVTSCLFCPSKPKLQEVEKIK